MLMSDFSITMSAEGFEKTEWLSPAQSLIQINQCFCHDEKPDAWLRELNFMSYELQMLSHDQNENEVLATLNSYFFITKKFRPHPLPILLRDVLRERRGCSISLAFIYMHLAESVGLNMELVHWPLHSVLKWCGQGNSRYVDLEFQGKLLSEDELILLINTHKEKVQVLNLRQAVIQYLSYISLTYRQAQEYEKLHTSLSMLLQLEPENTRFLAERALLRKELGLAKESLNDFKRFFSFIEKQNAPGELLSAYNHLKSLTDIRL